MSAAAVVAFLTEAMCVCSAKCELFTLPTIMLPESDPQLIAHRRACEELDFVRYTSDGCKWHETNAELLQSADEPYWKGAIPSEKDQLAFPTLKEIRPREFEVLGLKFKVAYPERVGRAIHTSSSMARCHSHGDVTGTLTTKGRVYLSDRCRMMRGTEALLLQGIHYLGNQCKVRGYADSFLIDLAGNAFHVWACAAMQWIGLLLRAECALPAPCPTQDQPLLGDGTSDDEHATDDGDLLDLDDILDL